MEAIVGIALVSMIVVSLYSALSGTMNNVNQAKLRIGAVAIANEKMEILRNLDYGQIGTIGGAVDGPIPQEETVNKNGRTYEVTTDIRYVDDAFDGFFPEDAFNTDYKKAQVTVTMPDNGEAIRLFSVFAPRGRTLSINVVNSHSDFVPDATVELTDLDDNPDVNTTAQTDASGNLTLSGVPSQYYRINVSKEGYESSRTYPNPPDSPFTPIVSDLNLIADHLNTKMFIIDEAADLTLKAVNLADESGMAGIEFEVIGGKKIGIDPDTYKVDTTATSDENGEAIFNSTSSAQYEIMNIASLSNSDYKFLSMTEENPFNLDPAETKEVLFIFADKNKDSLVVSVKDSVTSDPLEGAGVRLTGEDFDETATSSANGLVYFPSIAETMNPGDYHFEVTKAGYDSESGEVSISNLIEKEVVLTAQ